MDTDRLHPSTRSGDPFVAADHHQGTEELLEVAEATLDWLYDRRAHMPPEMLDPREARHRKALREAIRRARS